MGSESWKSEKVEGAEILKAELEKKRPDYLLPPSIPVISHVRRLRTGDFEARLQQIGDFLVYFEDILTTGPWRIRLQALVR